MTDLNYIPTDARGNPLTPGGIFICEDGSEIRIHHTNPLKNEKGHWLPGQSGNKHGRPPGVKNRLNVDAECDRLNCNPIEFLALVTNGDYAALYPPQEGQPRLPPAAEDIVPLPLRMVAATTLMKYRYPQLKAVEVAPEVPEEEEKELKGVTIFIPDNGRGVDMDLHKLMTDVTDLTETSLDDFQIVPPTPEAD